MKQLIIYVGFLIIMVTGLTGCYRDVILPDAAVDPDGPPQAVSLKTRSLPWLIPSVHWQAAMYPGRTNPT